MPPDDSGRTARDLLLNSWPGRLFIIAAALKVLVALVRLVGDVPAFLSVSSTAATVAPGVLGPLLPHPARLSRPAAPALARPPEADPLLHLHRRRSVAADPRILPAEHGVRGGNRRRVPLSRRLRRRHAPGSAAGGSRGGRDRARSADDGGDSRSRAAEWLGVARLSDALDGVHSGVARPARRSCLAARGSTCAGSSTPSDAGACRGFASKAEGFTGTTSVTLPDAPNEPELVDPRRQAGRARGDARSAGSSSICRSTAPCSNRLYERTGVKAGGVTLEPTQRRPAGAGDRRRTHDRRARADSRSSATR